MFYSFSINLIKSANQQTIFKIYINNITYYMLNDCIIFNSYILLSWTIMDIHRISLLLWYWHFSGSNYHFQSSEHWISMSPCLMTSQAGHIIFYIAHNSSFNKNLSQWTIWIWWFISLRLIFLILKHLKHLSLCHDLL